MKYLKMCLITLIISVSLMSCQRTVENAFINYEQFQEIYNTCQRINADIGMMEALPADDIMFAQFTKSQRLTTLRMQLNRWVEDYNAKSKLWHKSMWKSNSLPHQLKLTDFNNY